MLADEPTGLTAFEDLVVRNEQLERELRDVRMMLGHAVYAAPGHEVRIPHAQIADADDIEVHRLETLVEDALVLWAEIP